MVLITVLDVSNDPCTFIFKASESVCVKVGFSGRAVSEHKVPFTMDNLFTS